MPESIRETSSAAPEHLNANGDGPEVIPKAKKVAYNKALILDDAQITELESRETKNWLELSMLEKLDSMHLLTEWQFQNATKLRTLMKTDDENATWVSLFSSCLGI